MLTLCLFVALAQVPIEKQPDLEAFRTAVMEARAKRLDPAKAVLNHLSFIQPPPMSAAVRKVGKQTYLEVTALDLSYDGKPNSKLVKFRDVRIAMPRLFESSGK
jgi:hypothetical protein